jgi:hypothetical protein
MDDARERLVRRKYSLEAENDVAMEPVALTESATFVLDSTEAAEVRKLITTGRNPLWLIALYVVIGMANGAFRLASHGIRDILGWVCIGAYGVLIGMALAIRYLRFPIRTEPARMIVDSRGIQVVQNSRTIRSVPYAEITRVRIRPSVLVIEVRWARAIAVARRSLPDFGDQLIRIFESRLIGKRMLVRQSPSSIIVNTASP